MADPVRVLGFWLNEIGPDGWFSGDPLTDTRCRAELGDVWQAAHDGGLEHWVQGAAATLAYLVLCDQIARNIHRGSALAFATDGRARAAARRALAEAWDMAAPEPERQFFYLPFEHSENSEDQDLAVRLMTERLPGAPDPALHARAHQQIIARFGRFPFRNAALGRRSTAGEEAFMAEGGYGAVVRAQQS